MLAEKFVSSAECLYRLFKTTRGTASRLSVTTMRMPTRSEDSSSILEMPTILPAVTCSAMLWMKLSGLTWYGSSVMVMTWRLPISSISVTPRMRMEPRPVA